MNANHLWGLIEKLNAPARAALEAAIALCVARTHYAVEIEHVLSRLSETTDTDWAQMLLHFQVDSSRLSRDLEVALGRLQSGSTRPPAFSRWVLRWLEDAWLCASVDFGATRVRSSHLMLAGFRSRELEPILRPCSREFDKISSEVLEQKLLDLCAGSAEDKAARHETKPGATAEPEEAKPGAGGALARFGTDLTARARAGKLDQVLGRDAEIRQMIEILLRYRQNNPILVGEAGVGKTALVEGLALLIARGEVPDALRETRIFALDLGLLQAGAGVRGEFESRLKGVLDEVKSAAQPIILFIDEAHTLIGAGGQSGQGDAANLLKPALARGELRAIAATTWAEYKQYIEDDAALTRRFQQVKVGEPSEATAQVMLRGLLPVLERHHGLRILPEAVEAAVRLSHRYISDRQLPDKAVSVLSTACARVALSQQSMPAAIDGHRARIAELDAELALLSRETKRTEQIAELLVERRTHEQELEQLEARWKQELELVEHIRKARQVLTPEPEATANATSSGPPVEGEPPPDAAMLEQWLRELATLQGEQPLVYDCVSGQSVAEIVASWTGVPIGKMMRDELQTVINLDEVLKKRVLGQDHALSAIARRIATSRAELEPLNRPIGVFLLVGPSGVGKTETALSLASALYGGERNVITINMAEYKEPHSVAGLKGAPPGYVGYGKGGLLTEAVRRRPYSVVLLDEFEKAHKEVRQMFYAVFDTGVLTDTSGREVNFRNTVILLTSNVASRKISSLCADPLTRPSPEQLLSAIRPELVEAFEEALLGRMVPIPYLPLSADRLRGIVELQLDKLRERLQTRHHATLSYDAAVVDALAQRSDASVIGARSIEQTVNRDLLTGLSRALLERMVAGDGTSAAHLTLDENQAIQFNLS